MSSRAKVFEMPQRQFLSAQTAAAIRKAIAAGAWRESLPSERRLCDLFQVSRPTIRTALRLIARERLIEIRHGQRNRLLSRTATTAERKSRLVLLVSHEPLAQTTLTAYQGITEMRARLADDGFATNVLVCPSRSGTTQQRRLAAFVRQNPVLCCVLISVSKDLQQWCEANRIPALVLGSCHATVRLPSLDVDYRSVCRHAVGVLRGKGHQRLAFVVPHSDIAGDLASEEGFREGCAATAGGGRIEPVIVRHNGTTSGIATRLDALFGSAQPPTALLVAKPTCTFAVMVYLLKHGLRVPSQISIVARDYDRLFEDTISHYRFSGEGFARRLSRLMSQLAMQNLLAPEPHLIFPRFHPGNTLAAKARTDPRPI